MKKERFDYITTVIGVVLLAAGLFLVKTLNNPRGFMLALPYVCIGIGCGVFSHGIGNVISSKATRNSPDIQKKLDIEQKDERNITIANRAKAKAYDLMTFVFGALMITFALMGVDMIAVLLLVFAYLFVQGFAIYYRCKYDKEM